jgi:hypothetical protein
MSKGRQNTGVMRTICKCYEKRKLTKHRYQKSKAESFILENK